MRALSQGAAGGDQPPRAELIGREWARTIGGTSFVSLSRRELEAFLTDLAARLLTAFTAAEYDRSVPRQVGADLVAAHFTHAESLDRSLAVLGELFSAGATTPELCGRLAAMQGALGAGYAQALQERTLAEQQRISTAALAARAAAERARSVTEARLKAVFAEAAIGIGIAETDGRFVEVNGALCEMFGATPDGFRTSYIDELIQNEDLPAFWDTYVELASGERDHIRREKAHHRRDGSVMWTDMVISLIRDPEGRPRYMVVMVEDITERHELQTRLRHQALHDPLTGLPNRSLFFDRLGGALADPDTQVGVCYLDLDGFKVVNDTLGHDVGDRLLQIVAGRLADALDGDGHLVARMGGDEFVVLTEPCTGTEQMIKVAQAALEAVRVPVHLDGHEINVSASVGVVESAPATTAAELMKAADTTLYWAKADGRGRWALFDADRHAREVSRYRLSARIPEALAHQAFFVEYQPLVRLADSTVIGVEALVRWRHRELGVLGPSEFVGLAEETGLIVPLGRWVLAEACRQGRAWQDAHPDRPPLVSVNLAARQVYDQGIVKDVAQILAQTGLDPGALQLELTESAIMGTTDESLATLHALAELGVRIAIDDFGTGYSNLAYLRDLPVHALKLAGPFVSGSERERGGDQVDREIVATVVRLAHTLELDVTAESVETAEQADQLRALGCDTAQGWYYAAAGPASAISPLLNTRLSPQAA